MGTQAWTSAIALIGVTVGGALSFAAQWVSHRAQDRQHHATRQEARRNERLSYLVTFLEIAQEAERTAMEQHPVRTDDDEWRRRAEAVQDRLWAAQKTLHMLCQPTVAQPAHAFAQTVNHLLWHGPGAQPVRDFLHPTRNAFLDAARSDLERHARWPGRSH
ncbi:hypothetical protein F7R91_25255 [Streptomyces luteolifulvus]|jgi:hypothetical protein|uniref:Protein kilB n=1 Tax=Streptomyces luteolifulvus TaxID=2615112 RepID=A0A6H9UY10_9ACTN|nr:MULTISPECIES: hypothetical protein [Streptomyces]KAB1143476.1 hypothetical protein F7R91_25255 [Streptomyces luteolifulvus]MXM66134.1 hypothetical protein [Streptomyces sp. HUCO-GS316]